MVEVKYSIWRYVVMVLALSLVACSSALQRYQSDRYHPVGSMNAMDCLSVLSPSVTIWRHYPGGSLKLDRAAKSEQNKLRSVVRNVMGVHGKRVVLESQGLNSSAASELVYRVTKAALDASVDGTIYSLGELSKTLSKHCDRLVAINAEMHINHADGRVIDQSLQLVVFAASSGEVYQVLANRGNTGSIAKIASQWHDDLAFMLAEVP